VKAAPKYSRSNLGPAKRKVPDTGDRPESYDTEPDLVALVTRPLRPRLFTADEDTSARMNLDGEYANDND